MHMKFNLNGDKGSTIRAEFAEIWARASDLREAVAKLTINGRNYPDDFEGFKADQVEKMEMIRKVEEVRRWAQNAQIEIMRQTDD